MPPSESYRELIRKAIQNRTGETILNSSIDHAAVIIEEAFNSAKKKIRILSSRLDPSCYAKDSLCGAAKYFFLDQGHEAEILIESEENIAWSDHPFFQGLLKDGDYAKRLKGRLRVKRVPKKWSTSYKYNFLLLDDYGFRFEPDRSGPAAVAAFFPDGKKDTVDHLSGIFDRLWKESDDLQIN
jgi:hypothetical protein